MPKATDIHSVDAKLYFLPIRTRIPLKFGAETTTSVTCARVCLTVEDAAGHRAEGWGETPLSVQWVWPSKLPYEQRHQALKQFTASLVKAWVRFKSCGHALEVGWDFLEQELPGHWRAFNQSKTSEWSMPWLAALVCCSAFDLALHDAYGQLHRIPVYESYNERFLNRDLSSYLAAEEGSGVSFQNRHPSDYLVAATPPRLPAWHLVGGLDLLDKSEITGSEPNDGYPVVLTEWIERDGLKCLKIKLRGNDAAWDYARLEKLGKLAREKGVQWLSGDFNCTVTDPAYVNEMLDRFRSEHPRAFEMLLYVEQPFPYELEHHPIDVHSVSRRKPLFLDESAHDWRMVKLGRKLGWTGVALKTCKTQTGALLSCCWAKAHGMSLMVQDLTNPMLAQIPHVLLAAHTGTIMGVETNAMQFYPEASNPEAVVHPGLYQRRNGEIDLTTIRGPGFGYRLTEINRVLGPEKVV